MRLIIDDTTCSREGENIQGLGWHQSGNGLVKGLCVVTAVLRASRQTFAWDAVSDVSRKIISEGFRSKVDIADDIIVTARGKLGSSVTVLMDSWYSCAQLLNTITRARWIYVAAVRANRNVVVDGWKTTVHNPAKGPRDYRTVRLSRKRVFRVARRIVTIPKVGSVVLFICKHRNVTRFLISNDLNLTPRQMGGMLKLVETL